MFVRHFRRAQLLCRTNLWTNSRITFCSSQETIHGNESKTNESKQEETEEWSSSSLSPGTYVLGQSATFVSFDPTLNFGIRNKYD